MSTPRLCDSCGDIFSELEKGWTTSTQTQIDEDEQGNNRTVSVRVDACPECSPKTADTIKRLRARRNALKTATLEIAAGIRPDPIDEELRREAEKHDAT